MSLLAVYFLSHLLLSGIQLDRKESLDQPYLEQQTNVLLPNKELNLEKTTLCLKIERTRRLLYRVYMKYMKRAELLYSSSTIGKVLLRTVRKKECELHGRLRTRLSPVLRAVQNILIQSSRKLSAHSSLPYMLLQ